MIYETFEKHQQMHIKYKYQVVLVSVLAVIQFALHVQCS